MLFFITGDDGTSKEPVPGQLMKESENIYTLWCSGRQCVEGMLVELKFIKRQDLINVMSSLLKPAADQIVRLLVLILHTDFMSIDSKSYIFMP